jgi:threonine dehydratase
MSVNIIEIHHNRAVARLGETSLQMTLETRGFEHIDRIRRRLTDEGYRLHMEAPDRGAP